MAVPTFDILLCVDDNHERYATLIPRALAHGLVPVVTNEPAYFTAILASPRLAGVCLDFDLEGTGFHATGAERQRHLLSVDARHERRNHPDLHVDGAWVARTYLGTCDRPIVVVSGNPDGVRIIERALTAVGRPFYTAEAPYDGSGDVQWADAVLAFILRGERTRLPRKRWLIEQAREDDARFGDEDVLPLPRDAWEET